MTKKKILIGVLFVLIAFVLQQFYVFYIAQKDTLQSIYLVPKDAVYIIETQKPLDNWEIISKSDPWVHLQKNDYFKQLTQSITKIDTLFKQQKGLLNFIGNREVLISAHMYKPKDYSFLYIVDLQKIAHLNLLKNNISKLVNNKYSVTNRKYHNHEIVEIFDKKNKDTLYISFVKNQMIASYTHTLIEASIDELLDPKIGRNLNFIEILKKIDDGNLFKFYFQYQYLNGFIKTFTDKPHNIVKNLNTNLLFSGFSFDLENNLLFANGYTNVSKNVTPYLKAIQKSGIGKRSVTAIAPEKTAIFTSFSFHKFTDFYINFENILKENATKFKSYLDGLEKIENLLNINIKDNFISWIGNEIALIHIASPINNKKNDIALIIKTKNISKAKLQLSFILEQIKKTTPVKFKQILYKGHPINYLSIKGFFKILLGDLFKEIDKPYFTIIDDCVVFSNHPNTLKYIINQKIENKTLKNNNDFQKFNKNFNSKSSVFTFINTPILYNNIFTLANATTKKSMQKNKDFIICFPLLGFQLTPEKNMFKSNFVIKYQDPAIVKSKEIFETTSQIEAQIIEGNLVFETETPSVAINKKTVFNIPEIYPSDLNAKSYTTNFKNGNTHRIVGLKNGLKHGNYKEFYPNGILKISGKYRKGKQTSTWRAYNEKGELVLKKRL